MTVYYDQPQPSPSPSPLRSPTPSSSPKPSGTPSPSRTPSQAPKSASPTPSATPAPTVQPILITSSKHFYQGLNPGASVGLSVNVEGGVAPYELTWEWGDGSTSSEYLGFCAVTNSHTYQKAGSYSVVIRASDKTGTEGVLQLVVVINGSSVAAGSAWISPG